MYTQDTTIRPIALMNARLQTNLAFSASSERVGSELKSDIKLGLIFFEYGKLLIVDPGS